MRQYNKIALQSVRVVADADKGDDTMTSVAIDDHVLTFFSNGDSDVESPLLDSLNGDNGFCQFKVTSFSHQPHIRLASDSLIFSTALFMLLSLS